MHSDLVKPYFVTAQWMSLPRALQSGFLELVHNGIDKDCLFVTAAFLRGLDLEWKSTEPRLYLGSNNYPQIAWSNFENKEIEVQIMSDRIIWYVEGTADGIEYL